MKWQPVVIDVRVTAVSMNPKDLARVIQLKHITTVIGKALGEVKSPVKVTVKPVVSSTAYLSGAITHQKVWTIQASGKPSGSIKAK